LEPRQLERLRRIQRLNGGDRASLQFFSALRAASLWLRSDTSWKSTRGSRRHRGRAAARLVEWRRCGSWVPVFDGAKLERYDDSMESHPALARD
jgi:hypothetical protein